MNAGVIEKQPTSPVLLIDVRVADPCFQTLLPSRKENQEALHVKQQLGTCKAWKMLAGPDLQTTVLSGSLLTLQGGFCVLGLDSHRLGRSLSHALGAMFRRGQEGTEHADSTNQMRPVLLSWCWGGRSVQCSGDRAGPHYPLWQTQEARVRVGGSPLPPKYVFQMLVHNPLIFLPVPEGRSCSA